MSVVVQLIIRYNNKKTITTIVKASKKWLGESFRTGILVGGWRRIDNERR